MGKIAPKHICFSESPYIRSMASRASERYKRADETSTKQKVEAFFKKIKEHPDTTFPSKIESKKLQNEITMLPSLEASFTLVLAAPFRPDSYIYYSLLRKANDKELKELISGIPKEELNSYHLGEAINRACFEGNLPLAKHFFYLALKKEVVNTVIYNIMLKSASRLGDYAFSKTLFEEMPSEKKDSVTYGVCCITPLEEAV